MSDLVAGITVGLTIIPQAMAYASVAGIPAKVRFSERFYLATIGTLCDTYLHTLRTTYLQYVNL